MQGQQPRLPRWIYDFIVQQAKEEAPNECCGMLAGFPSDASTPVTFEAVFPLENEAHSPTRYFCSSGLFEPFKQMRAENLQLLAIYHSHPQQPALPSATDLSQNYYPDVWHAIVSLEQHEPQLNFFQLHPNHYEPIAFEVTDEPTTDEQWLRLALQLSRRCPKTNQSFAVGAVITDQSGKLLATGYSLEWGASWHAEHVALEKAVRLGHSVQGGTVYCTMEPCSIRLSGKTPCAQRIADAGISRVVFILPEPPVFVRCEGVQFLTDRGITVERHDRFAEWVERINAPALSKDS